ncbi:hypothetical protein [Streptomyces tubercidicus]|uniref:hypothetical protein n=1 Tax=Streptomyces tubercidicus TaxID=47759 RepID=UPI0034674E96
MIDSKWQHGRQGATRAAESSCPKARYPPAHTAKDPFTGNYTDAAGHLDSKDDGSLLQDAKDAPKGEPAQPTTGADNPRVETPAHQQQRVPAGVGGRGDDITRVGSDIPDPGRASHNAGHGDAGPHDNTPMDRAGDGNTPGGRADSMPTNSHSLGGDGTSHTPVTGGLDNSTSGARHTNETSSTGNGGHGVSDGPSIPHQGDGPSAHREPSAGRHGGGPGAGGHDAPSTGGHGDGSSGGHGDGHSAGGHHGPSTENPGSEPDAPAHDGASGGDHDGRGTEGSSGDGPDGGSHAPSDWSDRVGEPERANEPIPALTAEERAAHWGHLDEVENRAPEEFDHLKHDPDHKNQIDDKSMDEARVGLDLRESGRLPADIRRPELADKGEFYSESTGEYYDIKGVHSDYPPFNNVRDKSQPFKGAYDPANNEAWVNKQLAKQIEKRGRIVIIDVRNANQAAIDSIKDVVESRGWGDRVIWYP